jgi:predicted nucleic acid-binding protein
LCGTAATTRCDVPTYAYADASALVKLVVEEAETAPLESYLANIDGLVSSRLAATELARAAGRAGRRQVLQRIDDVLDAVVLVEVTRGVLAHAGSLQPYELRTLDAIHLATALSVNLPGLEFVTFDRRLADAAQASGLAVRQPGR